MIKEIPHSVEAACDVCGMVACGDFRDLLMEGWCVMQRSRQGEGSFRQASVCGGCLHVIRFREKTNPVLYSNKDLVLKWLAENE